MSDDEGSAGPGRMLEFAKTGRAKCKGSCKEAIPAGQLRYGVKTEINGNESWSWRCMTCMTKRVASNAIEKSGADLESGILFAPGIPADVKAAFLAYITALGQGDDGDAAAQLAILQGAKGAAPAAGATKAKKEKAKRPVEELLESARADGFSTLTADELKDLLRAKKGKVSGSKSELSERAEELYAE